MRDFDDLTPREQAVADGLRRGATNAEIAAELRLSIKTVLGHRKNLSSKTGMRTRTAWIGDGIDPATVDLSPFDLSLREAQVLQLLLEGLTNVEIGRRLYLSPETVKGYIGSAVRKVGATNRYDAAIVLAGSANARSPERLAN